MFTLAKINHPTTSAITMPLMVLSFRISHSFLRISHVISTQAARLALAIYLPSSCANCLIVEGSFDSRSWRTYHYPHSFSITCGVL